jgi:basic amino acid/polyamine antiporter, APA family
MAGLKRTLNLAEIIFFAAGVILGAGVYTVIGQAAGQAGNMLWLSFSIAALTALFSLFAYAELCALYPYSGGEFSFVSESLGIRWAYVVGTMVVLSGIISAATISIGFAGYLSELVEAPEKLSALCIIGFIFLVNVLGIRHSSIVNIIFTILEVCGLIFVLYSAAPDVGNIHYLEMPEGGVSGLLTAAAICFFAFTGFEDGVKLAEETKNPEKTIPKGLFIATTIVVIIYLLMSVAVVSTIPFKELAESGSPLSVVVEKRYGSTGAIVIAIVALFSTSNSLLSNMLGASRILYNFGKKNKKVKWFSRLLPKRKTPIIALLACAGITAVFSLIGDIKKVALITNFFVFLTFLLINISVIHLRIKKKNKERPFRIPGNVRNIPVVSVVAIAMLLVLLVYTVVGLMEGTVQ